MVAHTDDEFNPFDFFFNRKWNDFLKKGVSEKQLLIYEFNDLIEEQDTETLSYMVFDRQQKVMKLADDEVFRVHIVASLYVQRSDLALISLGHISPCPAVQELFGLIYFNDEKYVLAAENLTALVPHLPFKSLPAKVLSDYKINHGSLDAYKGLLFSILPKSAIANRLLGVVAFNENSYADAYSFFEQAKNLSHEEQDYLASLQSLSHIDADNFHRGVSSFYYETKSSLPAQKLEEKMQEQAMAIPRVKVRDIPGVASYLLAVH
jgi:tetratricopeptide (TPR) repeat protein